MHISKQESLLTLLFTDTPSAALIRNMMSPELFEGDYSLMVKAAFTYYDQFHKAPGIHSEELFADLFDSKTVPQTKQDRIYDVLRAIRATAPKINKQFVMNQLHEFMRQQTFKKAFIEVGMLLQTHGEGADYLEQAERIMLEAFKQKASIEKGYSFTDKDALSKLFEDADEIFPTGIKELDYVELGPQRKTLLGYIGPKKSGKTWFTIQLAKHALLHEHRVLHVSLEMREKEIAHRYLQSILAIPKREAEFTRTTIEYDSLGDFQQFNTLKLQSEITLKDPNIQSYLQKNLQPFLPTLEDLIIKDYPSGSLSINHLENYLDILDQQNNFTPDLLIVDYPRLMKISTKNIREELGQTYIELRRLASERNMAVVVPAQANREGISTKRVRSHHASEDISLTYTADTILTYSQTEAEHQAGLARLFVDDARNEGAKQTIVITQHYGTGQYCLESTKLNNHTGDVLEEYLNSDHTEDTATHPSNSSGASADLVDML